MGGLSSLRVASRMQILVALTLMGLLALCLTALFQLKDSMMEDRKQKTKNLVEVGVGILAHHHKLAQAGKLSEDDAKKAARDSLRALRYGKDDYFFGFDTGGTYFLHGGNPAMEGQLKIDMKDTNGKFLIKDLIAAGQAGVVLSITGFLVLDKKQLNQSWVMPHSLPLGIGYWVPVSILMMSMWNTSKVPCY